MPHSHGSLRGIRLPVNVLGFATMVNVAVAHLDARGSGHLVGISSLAALRGIGGAPAYAASKAFVSELPPRRTVSREELKLPIVVTDVQPGFVDTRMRERTSGWPLRKKQLGRSPQPSAAGSTSLHDQALATRRMADEVRS